MDELIFLSSMPTNPKVSGILRDGKVFCYCSEIVADEIIALYKKNQKVVFKKSTLPEREKKFRADVNFIGQDIYPLQHRIEFSDYWTEYNPEKDVKLRFEKEKSFNIKLRLSKFRSSVCNGSVIPKQNRIIGRQDAQTVQSNLGGWNFPTNHKP